MPVRCAPSRRKATTSAVAASTYAAPTVASVSKAAASRGGLARWGRLSLKAPGRRNFTCARFSPRTRSIHDPSFRFENGQNGPCAQGAHGLENGIDFYGARPVRETPNRALGFSDGLREGDVGALFRPHCRCARGASGGYGVEDDRLLAPARLARGRDRSPVSQIGQD